MRIAYVTTEFVTERNTDGGLANYLKRLCLSLRAMGHEPILFVSSDRDEVIEYEGISVHRVNVWKKPPRLRRWHFQWLAGKHKTNRTRLAGSWFLTQAVLAQHAQKPIDIVQYTNINGVGYLRSPELPSVIRISSFRRKWIEAYELTLTDKLRDLVFLEEAALAQMDAVYGPSHLIAQQITQTIHIPVSVIETPFFNEVKALDVSWYQAHLDGVPYVLFFGRLGLMKGIRAIADATFKLLSNYPDLRLVLIGQNAAYNERSALEVIQENAGVHRDRVLHFDKLAHEKLYPVIEHAQAVLLPSRIDNLSNTCIESMGLGQIVIGTNGASFEQLITDGENGFLCEIDDADSLLNALDKALRLTPEQRTLMSQNAQKRIERLRPEWTVNQLLAFYQEVISLKKGASKRATHTVNALNPSSV